MKLLKNTHIKSLMPTAIQTIKSELNREQPTYLTGIDELDRILGGFDNAHLIAIASIYSRIGSALLRNIALSGSLSLASKQPVLCCIGLQCENSYLLDLMASIVKSDKTIGFFAKNDVPLTLNYIERYVDILEGLKNLPIYISNDIRSIEDLKYRIKTIKQECGSYPIVAIDNLSQLNKFADKSSDYQSAYIIESLKFLAEKHEIPILFTSQVNTSDKSVALSDLEDIIHSELIIDKIITIDLKDQDDPFDMRVSVMKNKGGGTGRFSYDFDFPNHFFLHDGVIIK